MFQTSFSTQVQKKLYQFASSRRKIGVELGCGIFQGDINIETEGEERWQEFLNFIFNLIFIFRRHAIEDCRLTSTVSDIIALYWKQV